MYWIFPFFSRLNNVKVEARYSWSIVVLPAFAISWRSCAVHTERFSFVFLPHVFPATCVSSTFLRCQRLYSHWMEPLAAGFSIKQSDQITLGNRNRGVLFLLNFSVTLLSLKTELCATQLILHPNCRPLPCGNRETGSNKNKLNSWLLYVLVVLVLRTKSLGSAP